MSFKYKFDISKNKTNRMNTISRDNIDSHDILLTEVARLCNLICNSSSDTKIKGEIENIAISIAHHPLIIGR